ncbi:MAG: heat shock protein HspQ [Methylococcaceae bacterium]
MQKTNFSIGQIIRHKLFNYRGIIVDVDFQFSGTDEWYENVAHSRPSKKQPWYTILVDNANHQTYVAEQNLNTSSSHQTINNPLMEHYFTKIGESSYTPKIVKN